jgi:hypothetical protein
MKATTGNGVSLSTAGRYTRIGIGPACPSMARSSLRTSGWTSEPGNIAEPLACLLNISICCQLKRDSFHYLQQDGVDGRLLLSD